MVCNDGGMADTDLSVIVECARLAPSVHNTQPWRIVPGDDVVGVYADHERQLGFLDPTGRQLHVSCGAAIEFGYLAARSAGRSCTVELRPDPKQPDLLGRLVLGGAKRATVREVQLAGAIARRYTDRGPYTDRPLPPHLLSDVEARCEELGVWLRVIDRPGERTVVAAVLADAEAEEASDPRYTAELAEWTSEQAEPRGMPKAAAAPSWPADRVSDVPLRDFTGQDTHRHPGGDEKPPSVERDTIVMIGSNHDEPSAWLSSGRALGWLLLRSAADGVSAQPLGQAIDLPDGRARLRHEFGLVGYPQFLLRMGYGMGHPRTRRDQ